MFNLFRKPYEGYNSDKGLVKGLGEGFYDFFNTVTVESFNFTNKVRIRIFTLLLDHGWRLKGKEGC